LVKFHVTADARAGQWRRLDIEIDDYHACEANKTAK